MKDSLLKKVRRCQLHASMTLQVEKGKGVESATLKLTELGLHLEDLDDILLDLAEGNHLNAKIKLDKLTDKE